MHDYDEATWTDLLPMWTPRQAIQTLEDVANALRSVDTLRVAGDPHGREGRDAAAIAVLETATGPGHLPVLSNVEREDFRGTLYRLILTAEAARDDDDDEIARQLEWAKTALRHELTNLLDRVIEAVTA